MKKTYTGLALSITLAMSATAANAEMPIDSASAGVAMQSITGLDNGIALVLNAEKKLANVNEKFSVEGEFSYSISPASIGDSALVSSEISIMSLAGYGVYSHSINSQLSVHGRIGLLYESVSAEVCITGNCGTGDATDTGLSYGAGVKYNINDKMAVRLDYTIIDADAVNMGVGVSMGF